jgi:hypothetical protein
MFDGTIKLDKIEVPRTLLGTSPFMGLKSAHFGHRSMLYQLDFQDQPENVLKIIRRSYELGVRGIQLIPNPTTVEALKLARDEGCNMDIIGTVRPGKENEDIKLLSEFEASVMVIQDYKGDWDSLKDELQAVKDENAVAGLATTMPFRTTSKLLESSILDLFDVYMIPLNKMGYMMDCEGYSPEDRAELQEMIHKLDKTIIANKTLAAGILRPDEAFDYIKTVDYVDMIAVGIASEVEAEETFKILASK